MRQRLALARVLLPEPEVLLLDEPTSALDPIAARQVRRSLASLAQVAGRTVVLCTHDLSEAEQLCDRVVVLERGRIVADGSPAHLAAQHGTGGVLVEVAPGQVEVARRALAALNPAALVVEAAGRIRASGLSREVIPSLVASLAADGVDVYEVRRLDPTLEDVYLALHGRVPDDETTSDEVPS
jgi:ABC-type multidrug transport system ATPase subunit